MDFTAAPPSSGATLALLYDWEHDEFDDDVDFYRSLAGRTGGPVLEVACGSGRILHPLAKAGLDVVGVDCSADMLDRARGRFEEEGLQARLYQMDMTRDLPTGPFALVILALDAFGFVSETGDQIRLLQRVAERLTPEGLVVIDLVHPASLADPPGGAPMLQRSAWSAGLQAEVAKWVVRDVSFSEQQLTLTCFYDVSTRDGQMRRFVERVPLRHYSRFEMELLCQAAGLEIEGIFGDYELGPLRDTGDRMIFLAGRR